MAETALPTDLHDTILEHHDKVLIVDFGSQVTQLIARRVREAGVYCEIAPFQIGGAGRSRSLAPKAVILSGGPARCWTQARRARREAMFEAGVPVLGICYGEQVMAPQLGGEVRGRPQPRIRPRRESRSSRDSPLLRGRLGAAASAIPCG